MVVFIHVQFCVIEFSIIKLIYEIIMLEMSLISRQELGTTYLKIPIAAFI